jgi:inner membrane protein involved in colicin E2 resistance
MNIANPIYDTVFKYLLEDLDIAKGLSKEDPLLNKMVNRLIRAIADESMRKKMDIENEVEREHQIYQASMKEKDAALEAQFRALKEKDAALNEKETALKEKSMVIEQKDAVIEQKDAALEQKDAAIEQKDEALKAQAALIEALKQQLAEKNKS